MDASICPQTKDFQLKNIPSTIIKKKSKTITCKRLMLGKNKIHCFNIDRQEQNFKDRILLKKIYIL